VAQRAGERLARCDGLICVITVPSTFGAMLAGSPGRRAWLDSLPERVDQQCRAWNLSLDGDPWHGSNALVLPVRRGGEQFALRLTAPDESFPAEVAALRFWAGRGTVLLVETDLGAGTMLLERLDPARSLATLPLAEANHRAGTMMRRLAVPAPSWVLSTGELVRDRLATLKSDWVALGRPVPAGMLAAACTAAETLTSPAGDRAVDGALHHEQVLGGQREPWLTVDPRLLRGDIGYDLARCLWDRLHEMPDAATINEQLDIIADAAGLDRGHARRSAIFRTIDYWLWGLQHEFTEDPLRCRRLATALLQ
jgi:streptomycin 6-kinase